MSYSSHRRDAGNPQLPLAHRVSHARSCATLIAEKFGVHRDAVFARVRSQCSVDLADVKSEDELTRAMSVLEEIRFKGVSPEPKSVFVVLHVHVLPRDVEDFKMIGVYRTEAAAHAAVGRLRQQPGFQDHPGIVDSIADGDPNGFHVCEYRLDEDHWTEGFVTVD